MNSIYEYKKYKGWLNINFTKNIKLSDNDITEISDEINKFSK